MSVVGSTCFVVVADANTPLSAFLEAPVTTRSSSVATSEKQNNLKTTWILPQTGSEKTELLLLRDLILIRRGKTAEPGFRRHL